MANTNKKREDIAIMIPAAIGDENIPRKFVRTLNEDTLIAHAINIAKKTVPIQNICVLTDDEEIQMIAERMGAEASLYNNGMNVPSGFGQHNTVSILRRMEKNRKNAFAFVVWMGASCPLITRDDILEAVEYLHESKLDGVFSTSEIAQHKWKNTEMYLPYFGKHADEAGNVLHRETGAFFIMRGTSITDSGYSGRRAMPWLLPEKRSLEIHTFQDWWVAEKMLSQKRILFIIAGSPELGMGHAYRALIIAQEFQEHLVRFVCTRESDLATRHIIENHFPVSQQASDESLVGIIAGFNPDLVINDILDTEEDYVKSIKKLGIKVINFEDLGDGAAYADRVINSLYDDTLYPNMLSGPDYFCLRSEFYTAKTSPMREKVENVLITFGGSDSANLSQRVLDVVLPLVADTDICIFLLTGLGYLHGDKLAAWLARHPQKAHVQWFAYGTRKISEFMSQADFTVVSGGRTVLELAALQVPAIVIPVNEREKMHKFPQQAGMVVLETERKLNDYDIRRSLQRMISEPMFRARIKLKLAKIDLFRGKERVLNAIRGCLNAH